MAAAVAAGLAAAKASARIAAWKVFVIVESSSGKYLRRGGREGLPFAPDLKNGQPIPDSPAQSPSRARWLRRNSLGVRPVRARNARLKGPTDWNPLSSARVRIDASACEASDSQLMASSSR